METILITGGCGFIGAHLARALLDAGHRVVVLDDLSTGRRVALDMRATLRVGDVASPADVAAAAAGVDAIFHLAAIASVPRCRAEPQRARAVHADGMRNVLAAALRPRGDPAPVVLASSAAIYGACGAARIREIEVPAPISAYGMGKLEAETLAAAAIRARGGRATALRLFNVYGPGQDGRSPEAGVAAIFADRLRRGAPVPLHGDGGQLRDFVFVADVVAHLRAAMARAAATPMSGFDAFNVCTGRAVSLRGLLARLERLAGRRPTIARLPARPDDIRAAVGDPAAATAALGLRAEVSLAAGLASLLALPHAIAAE